LLGKNDSKRMMENIKEFEKMRTPKFRNGVLMILPIFLFVALLMYGCTINPPPDLEKTTEDCPVSGQEIQ